MSKKEQIFMPALKKAKGVMGVKGYEILFQHEIETNVEKNGLGEIPWWEVVGVNENIFLTLFSIFQGSDNVTRDIEEYYKKICDKTNAWVGERL